MINKASPSGSSRRFDRKDEFQIRSIASTAGIVLRNSLIFQQTIISRKKVNTLLDIAVSLTRTTELQKLLYVMRTECKRLLSADKCTVFLLDQQKPVRAFLEKGGGKTVRTQNIRQ